MPQKKGAHQNPIPSLSLSHISEFVHGCSTQKSFALVAPSLNTAVTEVAVPLTGQERHLAKVWTEAEK